MRAHRVKGNRQKHGRKSGWRSSKSVSKHQELRESIRRLWSRGRDTSLYKSYTIIQLQLQMDRNERQEDIKAERGGGERENHRDYFTLNIVQFIRKTKWQSAAKELSAAKFICYGSALPLCILAILIKILHNSK